VALRAASEPPELPTGISAVTMMSTSAAITARRAMGPMRSLRRKAPWIYPRPCGAKLDRPGSLEGMRKVWVLDTETKGTGAEVRPLETMQDGSDPSSAPVIVRPKPEPDAPEPAGPRPPRRFKVVDVMTRQVLLDDADARAVADALKDVRSMVDVGIYTRDTETGAWRRLSHGEKSVVWKLRGH
jgi:hypothetical protein